MKRFFLLISGLIFFSGMPPKAQGDELGLAGDSMFQDSTKAEDLIFRSKDILETDVAKSREFANQALDLAKKTTSPMLTAKAYHQQAKISLKQNSWKVAENWLNQAEPNYKAAGDKSGLVHVGADRAYIQAKQGKPVHASLDMQRLLRTARNRGYKLEESLLHRYLGFAYAEMRDFKASHDEYLQYIKLNDRIGAREYQSRMKKIEQMLGEREQELEALRKSRVKGELSAVGTPNTVPEKQPVPESEGGGGSPILPIALGGALLIALGFAGLVYSRGKKQIKGEVEEKNTLEERLHEAEAERYNQWQKETARMENYFQLMTGLVQLPPKLMNGRLPLENARESRNRRNAIQLLNKELSQQAEPTLRNPEQFIRSLTGQVSKTYGYENGQVMLSVETDPIQLDVTKALPIMLIINELVSNAFKYAYQGVSTPELFISMRNEGGELHLIVGDNGKGLAEGFDPQKDGAYGLELVRYLTEHLNGEMLITSQGGLCFDIIMNP